MDKVRIKLEEPNKFSVINLIGIIKEDNLYYNVIGSEGILMPMFEGGAFAYWDADKIIEIDFYDFTSKAAKKVYKLITLSLDSVSMTFEKITF
jgi:hypothetical protein